MECRIDKSLPVGRIACKQGKNFETFLNTEMNDIERCKIGGLPNGSKVLLLISAKVEGPRLGVEAHLSHSKNQCQRQRETESETKQVPDCGMQNPNLQHNGISKKHRLEYIWACATCLRRLYVSTSLGRSHFLIVRYFSRRALQKVSKAILGVFSCINRST